MSNSTTVAASVGVGALGVLAYYGYQNLNGKTVDEQTLYNEIDSGTMVDSEATSAVQSAKKVWSNFWQGEYDSMDNVGLKVQPPEEKPKEKPKEETAKAV